MCQYRRLVSLSRKWKVSWLEIVPWKKKEPDLFNLNQISYKKGKNKLDKVHLTETGFIQNQEYISINKSLFALKECIRSIYLSKEYIPYRRSKLTILLREILYNNINIHFIGTINSSKICYPDIIDTIEYGVCLKKSNVKKIIRNDIISNPEEPEYKLEDEYTPNINISIKDLSKTCEQDENYNTGDTLIKRCQSAPTRRVTNNDSLANYYNFILNYYNFARKHSKIYKYLKNTTGKIKGDKSEEIRTLINKFSFENMKFIDRYL